MTRNTSRDKRAHRRVPARGPAEVGGEDTALSDISAGGLGAYVDSSTLAVGQVVAVEFELGDGAVATEAEVVRRVDDRVGLRFLSLDPKSLVTLAKYFAQNAE